MGGVLTEKHLSSAITPKPTQILRGNICLSAIYGTKSSA